MSAHGWNISGAAAKAKEIAKPVLLTRPDGSSSGLVVTAEGEVRRHVSKPQGKAARKEFKKLRRQVRDLAAGGGSKSVQRILTRKMRNLCEPVEHKRAPHAAAASALSNAHPFPDKGLKEDYTAAFLKGNEDARAGREFKNPHEGEISILKDAYWAGWNSGGGNSPETPSATGGVS